MTGKVYVSDHVSCNISPDNDSYPLRIERTIDNSSSEPVAATVFRLGGAVALHSHLCRDGVDADQLVPLDKIVVDAWDEKDNLYSCKLQHGLQGYVHVEVIFRDDKDAPLLPIEAGSTRTINLKVELPCAWWGSSLLLPIYNHRSIGVSLKQWHNHTMPQARFLKPNTGTSYPWELRQRLKDDSVHCFEATTMAPKHSRVLILGWPFGDGLRTDPEPTLIQDHPLVSFTRDRRSWRWGGIVFQFDQKKLRDVVRILYKAQRDGLEELAWSTIREQLGLKEPSLYKVFRNSRKKITHPAYGTMIVPGSCKGKWRFAFPGE